MNARTRLNVPLANSGASAMSKMMVAAVVHRRVWCTRLLRRTGAGKIATHRARGEVSFG
jgi:hypothetical protein